MMVFDLSSAFKAIGNTVKSGANAVVKGVTYGLDAISAAVTRPFQFVQDPQAAMKSFQTASKTENITKTVVNTGLAAAATVAAATVAGSIAAGTVVTDLSAAFKAIGSAAVANPKTAIAATVAAPVVISAVASSPKLQSSIVNAPTSLTNFGSNIGQLINEPSVEKAKELVKENPLLAAGTAAAGVSAVGLGTAGIVSSVLNTQSIREQTETIKETSKSLPAASTSLETPKTTPSAAVATPTAPQTPITPETKPLIATAGSGGTTTSKRKKRTSIKPTNQNIRQNVNVIVSNRSNSTGMKQTAKYIKREVLAV